MNRTNQLHTKQSHTEQSHSSHSCGQHSNSQRINLSDKEWVAALRGTLGMETQHDALEALARYQQVVAYNYLLRCTPHSDTLQTYSNDEIWILAEDHAYDFIEKLVQDEFVLLKKYGEAGRFTSWAARVLINAMISEMRKASWRRQVPMTETVAEYFADPRHQQPEEMVIQNSITAIIQSGLETLPERYRIVLTRCLMEGESSKSVAEELETTVNAVNVLTYRAKQKMRKYLVAHGMDKSTMHHFA